MRSEERQKYILKKAKEKGFVSIPKTAQMLEVSVETIRRDINVLCGKNLLKKVHGGAVPIKTPIRKDPDFRVRIQQNQQEKIAIGKAAEELIRPGAVVALGYGATVQTMVSCLSNVQDVTFVTISLAVGGMLIDKLAAGEITGKVLMIGGELNVQSGHTEGSFTTDALDQFYFDLAIVSCSSLSTGGAANTTAPATSLSYHMMDHAAKTILLVDSDKLGKNSVYRFAGLTDFDHIITDNKVPCPNEILERLSDSETRLTVVDCAGRG